MATTTKTTRSLKAACPFCGVSEIITLDLNDMNTINCGECDTTFTVQEAVKKAAEVAAKWAAIAAWVDSAPVD